MLEWLKLMLIMSGTALCSFPFRCPVQQEWYYRAKAVCSKPTDYRCVWDANLEQYVEQCEGRDIQMKGYKLIFSGGITRWPCKSDRYQPFMHTTDENSLCIYKKSLCTEIGQIIYSEGSGLTDTSCRCNHRAGYKFVHQPKHECYCQPALEDCSCVLARCPQNHYLGIDYKCRSYYDDFDWKSSSKCKEVKQCKPETTPEVTLLKDHSADLKYSSHSWKYVSIFVFFMLLVYVGLACFILWMCQRIHANVIKEDMDNLESIFDKEYLKKRLEGCKDQKLRFGVAGGTGVGKSTFINLLLDAKEGDENYAKTGRGDTTRKVTMYRHPKCDRFTITDMPGYNSTEFTRDKILDLLSFSDFDYFLLFFQDVLQENDIWIAKLLLKNRIPFSFVRTKLDLDINEIEAKSQQSDKRIETEIGIHNLKEQLKTGIYKEIQIKNIELFLISNFKEYFNRGDLIKLIKAIASILPDEKMELFLFFLPILTPETIQMKYEELQKRVKKAAMAAGATAALPIPLIDIATVTCRPYLILIQKGI